MKRIILFTLVIVLSLPTLAQQTTNLFEKLTDQYADKDGFSASQISNDMFDLYLRKNNIDEKSPVYEALKDLDNILVISYSKHDYTALARLKEKEHKTEPVDVHAGILEYYKKQRYTLLKTEKRMGEDVKVYLKKNHDIIESLALITNSNSSTNLVELQGDIDLKTVSELSKALNLRGLENLYKIDNSNTAYDRAFGLSSGNSWVRIEDMISRQRDLAEKQHDLSDEQRAQYKEQAQQMAEKQALMAEKYREMAEKYRRQPIFLNYPGDTNTVYYLDGEKVKAKEIKELDKEKIESVEVNKAKAKDDKTTVRIKTK